MGHRWARAKRARNLLALCALSAAAALSGAADASSWNREDGRLLLISRVDYFTADLGTVGLAGEDVEARFERLESNTYLEYGLTDRVMIGGKAFYGASWLTRGATVETASGFSEYEGFAQVQAFRSPRHAGAIKLAAGSSANFGSGARPSLQSDGVDAEIAGLYGRTFTYAPVVTFVSTEFGYRRRFGEAADQLRLLTTFGADFDRVTILVDTFSVKSLRNEEPGGADFDVFKLQPSVVVPFAKRFAIQAGVSWEAAGRNIDLGETYFLGLWTKF